ncbi:hypothetical protein BDP81DRAFT_185854 [Colletotrichum phormii]|uniref:Uncharacterized protein n=1 Tax=Colletotrichum phormii TaxID=359342 RepID=A0AAJ0EI52_9PEZI|nr:uncharacterized protein BDP81DRAFT_185854 [Colletotrichum phormii]KAK1639953.1 hypothetical protein BDP81DRAFT_185854 [Colletotrichum phormii]
MFVLSFPLFSFLYETGWLGHDAGKLMTGIPISLSLSLSLSLTPFIRFLSSLAVVGRRAERENGHRSTHSHTQLLGVDGAHPAYHRSTSVRRKTVRRRECVRHYPSSVGTACLSSKSFIWFSKSHGRFPRAAKRLRWRRFNDFGLEGKKCFGYVPEVEMVDVVNLTSILLQISSMSRPQPAKISSEKTSSQLAFMPQAQSMQHPSLTKKSSEPSRCKVLDIHAESETHSLFCLLSQPLSVMLE